jgi:hypothetical protein
MAGGKYPSKASIWLDVKFPVRIASRKLLEAGETDAVGGSMPILILSSTSLGLDVGKSLMAGSETSFADYPWNGNYYADDVCRHGPLTIAKGQHPRH